MTKTSEEVFKIVNKVSIVGFVLECLKTHSDTEKERYEELKSTLFQTGLCSSDDLQKQVKMFVDQKETVVVAFSKKKSNAKVGCTKQFKKGFAYYVGGNPKNLVKHYVHWDEEKQFLLGNIQCLNADIFFVEVLPVNYATNLSVLHVSLSSVDKELLGEFSLYLGYNKLNGIIKRARNFRALLLLFEKEYEIHMLYFTILFFYQSVGQKPL